ncbi:MAG: hypothetical protein V1743_08205 [Nanoarchaeota archaeon]
MCSALLSEGFRFFRRSLAVRLKGFPAYEGSDKDVCTGIVASCFNEEHEYFMASAGNFRQFFTRDFGLCVESLLKLGYEKEVRKTLEYALSVFSRHGKVATQLTPGGIPVDSFGYSSDSLPFLIRSLRIAKAHDLVFAYKPFLENEVLKYREKVFDSSKGIVKRNTYFSSIRDQYTRDSSCYDNCCVAMLSQELELLRLKNPFQRHDLKKNIRKNFWNGRYFSDDLSKEAHVAGDANVFPFYFGIFDDKKMMRSSIAAIRRAGLDKPFPLKYANARDKRKELWVARLTPNYEGSAVWLHLGLAYLHVVSLMDKRMLTLYLEKYKKIILTHQNFLEVFTPEGKPYHAAFYMCDDAMLWAASYLALLGEV